MGRESRERGICISFGTGMGCPSEEYSALGETLNAFGIPFLWTLKDELKNHLPSGFHDRTKGKVVSWEP
ncbi:Anthocyanidin 3-O-glucosyltransferase [Euphorbia peplus]|nr:Anthocyanidin 3-O-glucosyltransferase [Euphorbia peplus]